MIRKGGILQTIRLPTPLQQVAHEDQERHETDYPQPGENYFHNHAMTKYTPDHGIATDRDRNQDPMLIDRGSP